MPDTLHVMTLLQRCLLVALCLAPAQAAAEFELSVYTGVQSVADSDVEGSDPDGLGDFDFSADWEGRSGETPPYYGIRGTWWREDDFGFGLEFTHNKVYASDDTLEDEGFDTLEFTDGQNLVTAHVMRRFTDPGRRWTPYVGAGVGVNIPYVEVETDGTDTFEYQYAGPAATWMAGVTYPVSDRWSVFGEYKGSYAQNNVDLDGGGELDTNILTNAVNLGVSFNF